MGLCHFFFWTPNIEFNTLVTPNIVIFTGAPYAERCCVELATLIESHKVAGLQRLNFCRRCCSHIQDIDFWDRQTTTDLPSARSLNPYCTYSLGANRIWKRYTWRHNSVLLFLSKMFFAKAKDIQESCLQDFHEKWSAR